jgi:DNA polymerase I-like protein with 3'-5' exonuclease and polymerase domains
MATALRRTAKSTEAQYGRGQVCVPVEGAEVLDGEQDRSGVSAPGIARARTGSRRPRYSTDTDAARKLIAKTGSLSVDLETRGLHPHSTADAAIGAVIVRTRGKNFIFRELPDWWPEVYADADTRKIGQNLKFDSMWMIEFCPGEDGLPVARNLQDTMLKSQLVHRYKTPMGAKKAGKAHLWQPNDLKSVLLEQLGVTIGKQIDHEVTDWTGSWSDEMIDYMLEDIGYLEDLNDTLDKQISESGQERVSWIEMGNIFATAWMTLNGIRPDVNLWLETISGRRDSAGNLVTDEYGTPEVAGWLEEQRHMLWHLQKSWPGVDNYNSPAQLVASSARVLGSTLINTKKATLKQLQGTFPAVSMLLDQRQLATYLKNWGPHYLRDYVCAMCGRFHPNWNQIGTETTRPSASKPNPLQYPRAPEFRRMIIPDPGYSLASLDYSAIEVLTAAIFADEPRLLEACKSGDPHRYAAALLSGKAFEDITKDERQRGKIANFGLLFGGGAEGLVTQARDLFDVDISLQEAQQIQRKYYAAFPELRKTKNWAYRAMESTDTAVVQTNAVGFRRYLEGYNRKPTSWLNTWIQSTAQAGMKTAMMYLSEARLLPFVCGQIYDEVLFEFPNEQAPELAERAKTCMLRGMQDVLGPHAPIHVDVNIGKVWL